MFALKAEVAAATRPELSGVEPYDGALDQFERGMTSARLDSIFAETKAGLAPLLAKVLEKKRAGFDDAVHPALAFDHPGWKDSTDAQAKLSAAVARDMGFDFGKGRFDVSTHPFTGGACPADTRITTRYSDDNWLEGFAGTVHEVGHALYEQGRDTSDDGDGLPSSVALSMGTHESQSLLWERMVLQSRDFWDYAAPLFHEAFPPHEGRDARRLLPRDQPQIFEAATAELPDLAAQIRGGDFAPLRAWLQTKIHAVGSLDAPPDDLLRSVAGSGIDPKPFLAYLEAKYAALYDL
ncbi:M32-like metallopeptidase [Aureococcus anophagefferens]|nr:M32-like metallopeptidase [Aureococcus anophagefferens]